MNTYATENKAEDKEEKSKSKELIVVPPKESRLKADPKLWADAAFLADMLKYCRPHTSKAERSFIAKYIVPLEVKFDKKGNAHKIIGDAPVIWSSHTDTVHTKQGIQRVIYWVDDASGETMFGSDGANASCLGADDTAGIWLMLQMINAKVPGHYIFHRGEECGGIGSRWIAKECAEMLKTYQFAIAFDRKDVKSIITHQGSKKTASDEFAKLLAEQIGMGHEPDSTGMWTDTAAYVDEIAECTNLSVGYYNAHGRTEKLNLDYLFKLRDAMCKIDVSKFVATRKPGDNSYKTYRYEGNHYHDHYYGQGRHGDDWWNNYDKEKEAKRPEGGKTAVELNKMYDWSCTWMKWFNYDNKTGFWVPMKGVIAPNPEKWRRKNKKPSSGWFQRQQEMFSTQRELKDMKLLIQDNPEMIADLLDGQGYGPLELKEYIKKCGGLIQDDIVVS